MDRLFLETGKQHAIPITTGNIADETGTVNVSEQDMVINAISDMTIRSRAFEFFTIEETSTAVLALQEKFAPLTKVPRHKVPRIYIRGSISQSDNSITADSQSGSVTLPFMSVGSGKGQVTGTISIDLQLANIETRTVIPYATTSNTITIVSNDDSKSARGLINNGGFGGALSISLSSAQREGRGQAVRTLMEYGLIELLGKYTHVPYQRCLTLESTDPAGMQEAQELYDELTPEQRVRSVQIALSSSSYYSGLQDGVMTLALQDAISVAKSERGLVPNGRIDFQLFNALYEESLINPDIADASATNSPLAAPMPTGRTPEAGRDPLGLNVALLNKDLQRGDAIRFRVSTTTEAQVYCYYEYVEESTLKTVRIFPNRFHSDNRLHANASIIVPREQDRFQILLNNTDEEAIACVATKERYKGSHRLPFLEQPDLEPLQCDYAGVACAIYEHQKVDALRTSAVRITYRAKQ